MCSACFRIAIRKQFIERHEYIALPAPGFDQAFEATVILVYKCLGDTRRISDTLCRNARRAFSQQDGFECIKDGLLGPHTASLPHELYRVSHDRLPHVKVRPCSKFCLCCSWHAALSRD